MILEDESDVSRLEYILRGLEDGIVQLERWLLFEELVQSTKELHNEDTHFDLKRDLIEHLWKLKGTNMRPWNSLIKMLAI
jgi:exonuclease VII small subunit